MYRRVERRERGCGGWDVQRSGVKGEGLWWVGCTEEWCEERGAVVGGMYRGVV